MNKNDDALYITREGLEKLKTELKKLIDIKRPEIAQSIQHAREMGDISENASYDEAKREQFFVEGRIAELETIIKDSKVASEVTKDTIIVGSKVVLHIDGDEEEFHIVGAPEADPMQRKISNKSPLGSVLMGKRVGEQIEVEAPIGNLRYTILKIR